MISHQHKCIFVHCQKCAGESIETSLTGTPDRGFNGDTFAGSPEKHFSAKEYKKKYGRRMWKKYFTFSFVRNPWDRTVSWVRYRDVRHGRSGDITPEKIKADLQEVYLKNNAYDRLLFTRNGILKEKKLAVDFVGRFENLQADFNKVCDFLNIPHQALPHKNKTNHRPYWEYNDEETKAMVGEIFKNDIEYFEYQFEK